MLCIGNVKLATHLLLSPISGYCDLAFRLTIRPLGGLGLASTDLVNPRGLLEQTHKSMELVQTDPADKPLSIQLYGRNPSEMASGAKWCQDHGATIVDINMGCPAKKIIKRQAGAGLLLDLPTVTSVAQSVVQAVEIPVTAKIRLGWDDDSIVAPELARALVDVGVSAITVHGRTAEQKFGGSVRLEGIARVVEAAGSIPVIGNGDVRGPADAKTMIEQTGCAGVMIGRAALSNPWIFRDTLAFLTSGTVPPPPSFQERLGLMNQHFEHLVRIRGERTACIIFRQRVSSYAHRQGICREIRDRIRFLSSAAQYRRIIESYLNSAKGALTPL